MNAPRALLLAVAFASATGSAYAQPRRPVNEATEDAQRRESARQHFEAGVRHAAQRHWDLAIQELEIARSLRPTPAVFFNLGMAYREAGRVRESITALEAFQAAPGTPVDPMRMSLTAATLDALRARFAHITLDLSPPEATATIDGEAVAARENLTLEPGAHTVRVEARGYGPETRALALGAGQALPLVIRLRALVEQGRLEVDSDVVGASIEIDGQRAGVGRVERDVTAGAHRVVVRAVGYEPFERAVEVPASGRAVTHAALRERSRSVLASPWFWVGTGVAVSAAIVVGIVLFGASTQPPLDGALGHVSDAVTLGQ